MQNSTAKKIVAEKFEGAQFVKVDTIDWGGYCNLIEATDAEGTFFGEVIGYKELQATDTRHRCLETAKTSVLAWKEADIAADEDAPRSYVILDINK